jgi:peptidoglycan DL-endopeptidase CwlO
VRSAPSAGNLQARIWSQAQAHIGKGGPYVYGGKSLTGGSDCSYLVYRILLAAGLDVPYRASGALRGAYRVVPRSQAVAGDLVYKPGHIGVYDGAGGLVDHGSGHGAKHQKLWYTPTFLRVTG